ncbi:MAG: HAMP domain-containing protein [Bacteroidales bacterium]|nr:HAMP domain-containing protein [Bacteroidales bacterium]
MKKFNLREYVSRLNIARKLIGGFGIIGAFIIINAILTAAIHFYSRSLQELEAEEYQPVENNVIQMMMTIGESRRLAVNWVFVDHQPNTPDKVKLANIVNTEFDEILDQVKGKTANWEQEFTDTLAIVEEKAHAFFDLERTVMTNLSTFDSYDDPILLMESEMLVQSDGDIEIAEKELQAYLASLEKICDGKCQDIKNSIDRSSILQLVFVALMSLLVLGSALLVGRLLYVSIITPLKNGVAFAEAIGNGDLTATVNVTQNDEIGQLARALQNMADNLKKTVVTIERNANELVSSGKTLNESSQKLSKGASEQAASAEEVSTAIEQMVANIDQNTENAVATEKLTASTVENVNLSSQYSGEAAEAMKTIAEKITIISDIAFQTNILALNAAVEAVRAGEQGRGFSVVAAEVRKLAERSKQAANEIVSLVGKGLKVTQMAGEKAKALVPDIEKTTVLIKEISAASIEQKTGAEQINMAMQNLNVITQENASSSDELTNSSVLLSSLAASLKEAVGKFKLDENSAMAAEDISELERMKAAAYDTKQEKNQTPRPEYRRTEDNAPTGHKPGVKIDLGSKEFDLDNYEKF